MAVKCRFLGSVALGVDETPVPGRQTQLLLALLACREGEPIAPEVLIDELWHGDPPASAPSAVRNQLTRSRRLLSSAGLGDAISLHAGGYALDIPTNEIDIFEFRTLAGHAANSCSEERYGAALQLAREALGLWRGTPFADLDAPTLTPVRQALVVARHELKRVEAESLLATGDAAGALLALDEPLASSPEDEALVLLAMLALHRSGRSQEAVATYQQLSDSLAARGLVPGPEVAEVESRILRHDPSLLDTVRPSSGQKSVASTTGSLGTSAFVGRDHEMKIAREALLSEQDDATRTVLVTGTAGIGKSALVERLAVELQPSGLPVTWGRAAPGTPPFLPVIQALGAPGEHLFHEVDRGDTDAEDALDLRRSLLFQRIGQHLEGADDSVIIIEDLHWIDAGSAALLRHLLCERRGLRPRFVVTARHDEAASGTAQADLIAALEGSGAVQIHLGGLSGRETRTLVELSAPRLTDRDAEVADRIHDRTDGNPLFVKTLLLEADDGTSTVDGSTPSTVRTIVERRLQRLSASTLRWIQAAATLGRRFPTNLASRVGGVTPAEGLEAVSECMAFGLARPAADQRWESEFVHDLMHQAVSDLTPPSVRADLHARTLAELGRDGEPADRLAPHALRGFPVVGAQESVSVARSGAAQLEQALGFEQAAELLAEAAEVARGDALAPEVVLDLELGHAKAVLRTNDALGSDLLHRALDQSVELGAGSLAAAAVGARHGRNLNRDPRYLQSLRAALAVLSDHPAGEAEAQIRLALDTTESELGPGPAEHADRAVELAATLGDPVLEARALLAKIATSRAAVDPAVRRDWSLEVMRLANEAGRPSIEMEGRSSLMYDELELGEFEHLRTVTVPETIERATAGGWHRGAWHARIVAASVSLVCEGPDRFDEMAATARDVGMTAGLAEAIPTFVGSVMGRRFLFGDLGASRDEVAPFVAAYPDVPVWKAVQMGPMAARGQRDDALELLRGIGDLSPGSLPMGQMLAPTLAFATGPLTWLDRTEEARNALAHLDLVRDRFVVVGAGICILGPTERFAGLLNAYLGDWESARHDLSTAAERCRDSGAHHLAAIVQAEADAATEGLSGRVRPTAGPIFLTTEGVD